MLKPGNRDNKKPYSSPLITVYGTIQELTQHVGLRGQPDSKLPRSAKTHT
jgi:hypothetical protein